MTAPTWPNRSVEEYIALLQDRDPRLHRQAAAALWLLDDQRAVDPLVAPLQHDASAETRENAARALAWLGDRRALAPLAEAVAHDADATVRATATRALTRLGVESPPDHSDALDALVTATRDRDTRYDAVNALAALRDPRALVPLLELLRGPFDPTFPVISYALSQLGESALQPLLAAAADTNLDFRSRAAAANALGMLGDQRAVEPLRQLLGSEEWTGQKALIEMGVAEAIGRLGDPQPLRTIWRRLKELQS